MMYAKLAFRNIRRGLRDYIIYFVTLTLTAALMYSFLALGFSPDILAMTENMSMLTSGNGVEYYRTRVKDADGKLMALYARTPEELYDKELSALEQIDNDTFCRKSPTVAEYCERWLVMQSASVRTTTLTDYTSKVRRHIIKELGHKRMADVTLDDIQIALVPVSKEPLI